MTFTTADLHDANEGSVHVAQPGFHDYGGRRKFSGAIVTLKVHEDNSLVREALAEPGRGRVLVIDGGASMRCALVGDKIAELGRASGWSGMVISGCVRDAATLAGIDIGIRALGTHPARSVKKGAGDRDVPVTFAGITFLPGAYLYVDEDGILISPTRLA